MTNPDDIVSLEVRDWVKGLTGHEFAQSEGEEGTDAYAWVSELQGGNILCKLLGAISDELSVKYKVTNSIWHRRDNVSKFLEKLKSALEMETTRFDVEDLLPSEGEGLPPNPRQIVTCLYMLTRIAYARYGIEPPQIVKLEDEFDDPQEEAVPQQLIEELAKEEEDEADDGEEEEEEEGAAFVLGQSGL
eukprot:Hpha_TRINITY_DN16724_c1_g1::TRINITY_DN16724_c1_g1_i1::g.78670::m.78670